MLSLIIKINDIHHCKETHHVYAIEVCTIHDGCKTMGACLWVHVYAIVRIGHWQPTWHMVRTGRRGFTIRL